MRALSWSYLISLCFNLTACWVNNKLKILSTLYTCMPSKRTDCWRLKMKNSFASEQLLNASEPRWVKQVDQRMETGNSMKKWESDGICSTLDTMDIVLGWERSILGEPTSVQELRAGFLLAELHLPELGQCFQEASSLWSRCRATSWLPRPDTQLTQATDVKTILNPGRARHKILFTQFPFCVRNRVVFRSAQFFVLFNFI